MEDVTKLKISNVEKERLLIKNLNNRPNAMATYGKAKMDSTATKDLFDKQFELITAKFNELCDLISEYDDKLGIDDIVDNLDSEDAHKVLSAAQGKRLKERINQIEISGGGNVDESDPTVPQWAKEPEKPTYTAQEVGADPAGSAEAVQINLSEHASSSIHLQNGERKTWNGYGEQIEGINAQIGEIGTALDEIHTYAVALAGGSV